MMYLSTKFRAKRTDNTAKNGQWVYGDLTHTQKITENGDIPCVRVAGYDIDEKTIGQYIGIKDENDNEIYTGDIINAVYTREHFNANGLMDGEISDEYIGVVYYDNDFYALEVKIIKGEGLLKDEEIIPLSLLDMETVNVIGNKWDNPKLLNRE